MGLGGHVPGRRCPASRTAREHPSPACGVGGQGVYVRGQCVGSGVTYQGDGVPRDARLESVRDQRVG